MVSAMINYDFNLECNSDQYEIHCLPTNDDLNR